MLHRLNAPWCAYRLPSSGYPARGRSSSPRASATSTNGTVGSSSWSRKPTTVSCCAPSSLRCSPKPRCNRRQVVCNPPMPVSLKRWKRWKPPFAKGLMHTMVAVDTNIIVRFLVNDDLAQFQRYASNALPFFCLSFAKSFQHFIINKTQRKYITRTIIWFVLDMRPILHSPIPPWF